MFYLIAEPVSISRLPYCTDLCLFGITWQTSNDDLVGTSLVSQNVTRSFVLERFVGKK